MRFLGIAVPRALPWAGLSFPLRGGIRNRATSKTRRPGECHFPPGRVQLPHQPDAPVLMLRLQFDVPKGQSQISPGQRPGNTSSSHVPSPDRAKQNSVFHGRLRRRNSRDLWRPYRACASLESRFPGRCPGLACRFPFGAEFGIAQHRKRAGEGSAISRPAASQVPHQPDAPVLMLRLQFDVPKGQSQISPGQRPGNTFSSHVPSPDRAKQNSVFHGRLRRRNSRDLWRPYRACASSESRFPGRCPGLACRFPFGAEFEIAQHRKRASEGRFARTGLT